MKSILSGDRRKTKRLSKRAVRMDKGSIQNVREIMKKEGKKNPFLYNLFQ